MSERDQFGFYVDSNGLFERAQRLNRVTRDVAALKARHAAKDPNVCVYCDANGIPERYSLRFTGEQCADLTAMLNAALPATNDPIVQQDKELGVCVLVRLLEDWGDGLMDRFSQPDQKTRKRVIESFAKACERLDASMAELDSAAIGWVYANIADALAKAGYQLSPSDSGKTSMLNDPYVAQIEGGEAREALRELVGIVTGSARQAADTLPLHEMGDYHPRLLIAEGIKRQFAGLGIPFEVSEVGVAANCLRASLELGGQSVERVAYWLGKVR